MQKDMLTKTARLLHESGMLALSRLTNDPVAMVSKVPEWALCTGVLVGCLRVSLCCLWKAYLTVPFLLCDPHPMQCNFSNKIAF